MRFEWDPVKAASNVRKHGVSFDTAALVFADPFSLTAQDRVEGFEYRWVTIGMIGGQTILLVAHSDRDDEDGSEVVRIISARRADKGERRRYDKARST